MRGKSARPLYVACCLGAVLLVLTVRLLPSDPLIAQRLHDISTHSFSGQPATFDPDTFAKMDIPLGTELPDAGAGHEIRATMHPSRHGYLLVGLGNCTSCIRFDIARWQSDTAKLGVPLIGFSGALPTHIAEFKHTVHAATPIVFDRNNALGGALNSYWNGRVFFFDSHWRLRWTMKGSGNPNPIEQLPDLRAAIQAVSL